MSTQRPDAPEAPSPQRVYLDLTHLGRHVTGIERVTIELFETVPFEDADVRCVRAGGVASMVLKQQLLLPLLAMLHPTAQFVFPGFPPSVLFRFWRERAVLYVHDAFLLTRRQDLSTKARLYMAWPFRAALRRLRYFLVNSEKTSSEIAPFVAPDARIGLYRPGVRNVFDLDTQTRREGHRAAGPLRLIALGTIEPRKNYPAAAAILDAIRAAGHPDAALHIIGRPGWGQDADRLAHHAGVTVHGYLAPLDAKALLEQADIYVCTSHDEGLGLPLLEAQFAGLPSAAPDAPVFREVLGSSGLFIDPREPQAAARIILTHLAQPDCRAKSADDARRNLMRWNGLASTDRARALKLFRSPLAESLADCAARSRLERAQ